MMNIKYLLQPFIILLLLTSSAFAQKPKALTEAQYIEEYDQFIATFEKEFIYLKDKKELFNCVKSTYRERVSTISTVTQHVKFYETLLNEFYDSHIHLNTNTSESYRLESPIFIKTVNGKSFIENVWQTQLKDTLKENIIGAEILSINDIKFQKLIDIFPTVCQNKQDSEIRNWIANKVVAGKRNEPRFLKLKLKTGKLIDFDLDSLKLRKEPYFTTPKIISENIRYIRINNSLGNEQLIAAINKTVEQSDTTKAMIIDLRNTVSGGNTQTAEPIMGRFIAKKQRYQLYQNHKRKYYGNVKPQKPTYQKPLYILVNRWTGSMGEGMAIGLDGMQRAIIVGTEMQRLAGGMNSFQFKYHSYSYRVSIERTLHIDGSPREKFVPKEYVKQTQVLTDEILERALELIKTE